MRKFLIGLAALTVFLIVTPAHGGWYLSGNKLMAECKDTGSGESLDSVTKYNGCISYLVGIWDAYDSFVQWNKLPRIICREKGVDSEQQRQVFLKWMNANPEEWHYGAGSLALTAFRKAWPCKE